MNDKYVLVNGEPVAEPDLLKWGMWFETADCRIARTEIGEVVISTVFLGLDFSLGGSVPILFETKIFGGKHDAYQSRYSSREAALAGHEHAVALVRE